MKIRKTYGPLQCYQSLLRFGADLVDDLRVTTSAANLEYFAWDSRLEEAEIPRLDLLGLSGWAYSDLGGGFIGVKFGVTISTISDANLMRETEIADRIHALAGVGHTIPIFDPTSGFQVNEFVVDDFDLMPPGQSELRNWRPIGFEVQLGRAPV